MRIGWIKGCEIKLHPLLIALVILAAWAGQLPLFMVAFGSVLYHELCHVMAAVLCGYSVTRIEVLPFGSVAQIQGLFEEQPQSEMLIALAGPAANVLMVMALTTLKHYTGLDFPYQEPFIAANLQLAVFNLLPLLPMDGGRILRSALARCVSLGKATRLAADLGILGGLAMAIAAAAGWLPGRAAMILLGVTVLLTALRERRGASWLWLKELTGKKQKLLREETMPVRQIVARWDMPLGQLAMRFIPHRYHLVTILDEKCDPIATLGENEVMEALMKRGANTRICAIIPGKG